MAVPSSNYLILLGCLASWLLASIASAVYPAAMPKNYGKSVSRAKFVPADPGKTPSCVKDARLTYCTEINDYPKERIVYLLENNMFDLSSIIMDETMDTYTFESIDPPKPMYSYKPPQSYLPPTPYNSSNGASRYNSAKEHYYSRPSVTSKYGGRPSSFGNYVVSNHTSSPSTSSYVSYISQPPNTHRQSHFSSFPPSSQDSSYGRPPLNHISHSQFYQPNSHAPANLDSNNDGPYPRYWKQSSRHSGPGVPPPKSEVWWRK